VLGNALRLRRAGGADGERAPRTIAAPRPAPAE
jgi:hypothetical protein